MKKTLLALFVLLSLVSCGKKNSVAAPVVAVVSPITAATPGAAQLGSMIDNYGTQFGTGQIQYGDLYGGGSLQTWGTLANTGLNLGYRYTKVASSTVGSNCEKKWGIFIVCSYSNFSSSTSNVNESRVVYNLNVDITSKINELKAILNNSNPLIAIVGMGTSYKVTTRDGKQYIIDTRYPLQANPIGIKDATSTEYLYNITEN